VDEDTLMFTEPNLAFSLDGRDEDIATMRVHLSLKAGPPWLSSSQIDTFGFYLEIHAAAADLARAAAEWDGEPRPFPQV
jgi:hypothetical protein